jgi:putative addiction module component (TIGR02574 family)
MSPSAQHLLQTALTLPEPDRLAIAEALFAASEMPPGLPTGNEWVGELQRRSAQIDAGDAVLTPWSEVKRRVRARLEENAGG